MTQGHTATNFQNPAFYRVLPILKTHRIDSKPSNRFSAGNYAGENKMQTHKQYRYRVYTEDKNRDKIQAIITGYFDSFTIFTSFGIWKKEWENSLAIEIITTDESWVIEIICEKIKVLNSQDCCLVTIEPVEVAYV